MKATQKMTPYSMFVCDVCKKPVSVEKGIVQHRPMPKQFMEDMAKWDEKNPGPAYDLHTFMSRPEEPELWQLGHLSCFKDINEDYWFPLDQCAIPASVLHWTAHLGHKTWFEAHDWARFLDRHFLYKKQSREDVKAAASKPRAK